MNGVAEFMVFLMMALTVLDIILRYFGSPVSGTYELMAVAGAIVIGLAIPKTSLDGGHIHIDLITDKLSAGARKGLLVFTRIPGIALFAAMACFLYFKGWDLRKAGEVSLILRMPQFIFAYILSVCCIVESLILVADIFKAMSKGEAK